MPSERRTLRSNKPDPNSEKTRSNPQSSKDKPAPTRASTRNKTTHKTTSKDMGVDQKMQANGANGTEDVEMNEDTTTKQDDGDEEMTVVVPPSKNSHGAGESDAMETNETKQDGSDPEGKALAGNMPVSYVSQTDYLDIKTNYSLLERAVTQFDSRFTLRVLRSIPATRKVLSADFLANVIVDTYSKADSTATFLLAVLGKQSAFGKEPEMEIENSTKAKVLPEVDTYLSILVQIYLYDRKEFDRGAEFSTKLVERLQSHNRWTLDSLAARVYFYYSMFYEQLAPLPPSPLAAVISIRQPLLAALRSAVLRKDQDTQATVTTLLLRNYLSISHISQADLFISHSDFPVGASNNQIARYLYYLGRIRAIQLQYTDAYQHLIGATRKSPSSHNAGGFYQASMKLLVVVELLMGDIPDRAIFRQPNLERALYPYLLLVQAVSIGDMDGFLKLVQTHGTAFRRDGTYTLILRLRQNVIKTGIRTMSLSYTRISLRDICLRLGLDSEETAEYIVGKAIRDGVIEASLDHERGFMKSKDVGDIYATQEPGEVFHDRVRACLSLHDESVKVCILLTVSEPD